ncbi:MAG: hypothetical protein HC784_04220 [Hydrococcus sp. CSU_1_8]|nr:hypothetical protein [Hydrococcus sp. CSU_1_8]
MQPVQAVQLIPLSISARSHLLEKYAGLVNVPSEINAELHRAYQIANVLASALPEFIGHQIQDDISQGSVLESDRQSLAIATECKQFANRFIALMPTLVRSPDEMETSPRNLYEMCGAAIFVESNSISRNLSTKWGNFGKELLISAPTQ